MISQSSSLLLSLPHYILLLMKMRINNHQSIGRGQGLPRLHQSLFSLPVWSGVEWWPMVFIVASYGGLVPRSQYRSPPPNPKKTTT